LVARWAKAAKPANIEVVAAGALGGRTPEIGIGEKCLEQGRNRFPSGGEPASTIEMAADFFVRPRVQQDISRSGIEAGDRTPRWKVRDVGDAAEIRNDAMTARIAKPSRVKSRNQRGTLSTGGDVPVAKIGDHRDAGMLGEPRGVA